MGCVKGYFDQSEYWSLLDSFLNHNTALSTVLNTSLFTIFFPFLEETFLLVLIFQAESCSEMVSISDTTKVF